MIFKDFPRGAIGSQELVLAILLATDLPSGIFRRDCRRAPAAAAAAPPACDAKTLTNCSPNSGDTWILTSVAIVLMMTIRACAVLRRHGAQKECRRHGDDQHHHRVVSILWLVFTYSIAFQSGTPFIGSRPRPPARHRVSDISKYQQSQSLGSDHPEPSTRCSN